MTGRPKDLKRQGQNQFTREKAVECVIKIPQLIF